jgi:chorismate mutase
VSLYELRKQIDAIDLEWVLLLGRRLEVAKQIALVKKRDGVPILDKERELAMMDAVRRQAEKFQISTFIVEELFHLILSYTKQEMQNALGLDE